MKPGNLSIRAGSSYRNKYGQVIRVKNVTNHPSFNNETYDYDISYVTLETPLQFNKYVTKISLASSRTIIEPGTMSCISGWGYIDSNNKILPELLKYVYVPIILSTDCREYYNESITDRMLCAGDHDGGKDSCKVNNN